MTTREKLEEMLVHNGMFDTQAKKVMDIAIPELNNILDDYTITFDRPASEYPNAIYTILFLYIKPIALKWIEENCPLAWYKPMFMTNN
jgi:hypothetical protein